MGIEVDNRPFPNKAAAVERAAAEKSVAEKAPQKEHAPSAEQSTLRGPKLGINRSAIIHTEFAGLQNKVGNALKDLSKHAAKDPENKGVRLLLAEGYDHRVATTTVEKAFGTLRASGAEPPQPVTDKANNTRIAVTGWLGRVNKIGSAA